MRFKKSQLGIPILFAVVLGWAIYEQIWALAALDAIIVGLYFRKGIVRGR